MNSATHKTTIFGQEFTFISDTEGGVKYDTTVLLNGNYLLTIAGCDIEAFCNDLKNIDKKYRI